MQILPENSKFFQKSAKQTEYRTKVAKRAVFGVSDADCIRLRVELQEPPHHRLLTVQQTH
jgi:hypothetical protein